MRVAGQYAKARAQCKCARVWGLGLGLVEVLVTLVVLTVGMLGLLTLLGVLARQSGDNRVRAEALLLARSRLEELRHEAVLADPADDFGRRHSGQAGATMLQGRSALFSRSERVARQAGAWELRVAVAWTGADGHTGNLALASAVAVAASPAVAAAVLHAGRLLPALSDARGLTGELPPAAVLTANHDGTALLQDPDAGLLLAAAGRRVLSLAGACQSDAGACSDFARISGRVWIDRAVQQRSPGSVFVLASGAAFCSRYYLQDGSVQPVTPATSRALRTPDGDYEYFDYACYMAAGWHGNIGLLLAGGLLPQDRICVGDPAAAEPGHAPQLTARRSYQGQLYRRDAAAVDGREKLPGSAQVRQIPHGIRDRARLPAAGEAGHDFVLTSMPAAEVDAALCVTGGAMLRGDASRDGVAGALFKGMPGGTVCLNDGLLATYDTAIFGHDPACTETPGSSAGELP